MNYLIVQEKNYHSPEEYLELEVNSQEKHEYIDGQIIPMTGGTPNHNQIAGNFYTVINFALKRQPDQVFIADQRLWIPKKILYTYPDIMIVATPWEYQAGRKDTLTNPVMIAEVLSKSTKSYDRDEKFAAYRTIPSFKEYILIDQYRMHIEQYCYVDANRWIFSEFEDGEMSLNLASIPCQISLVDIYDKVDFDAE